MPTPAPRKDNAQRGQTDAQPDKWVADTNDGNPEGSAVHIYSLPVGYVGVADNEKLAAQIVREHNTHADLLAALKCIEVAAERHRHRIEDDHEVRWIAEVARAAIAKAGT